MTFGLTNALSFRLIVTLLSTTCFLSCSSNQEAAHSTEDYYLNPLTFSGKGIVYRYSAVNDPSLPDEIWHYRFHEGNQGNFLRATMYTPSGEVVQQSIERVTRVKAQLLSLDLIYRDEHGQKEIATHISQSSTFIFGPIDSVTQTVYKIEYWDTAEDSVRVSLTKRRTLEGSTEYVISGEPIAAIRISTVEKLETETEGFTETTWFGTEIFGQDYGLVYYKKTISDEFVLEYGLVEIMTYSTLQARYLDGAH